MKKVLYAIKTTKKYQERIDAILSTWASDANDYIFYSDHEDKEKNVIISSTDSSYLSGTLSKTLWFFNNLKNIFVTDQNNILDEYDWIFFVDDDTFVNVKKTQEFIETIEVNSAYGHMFTPKKDSGNPIWGMYKNIINDDDGYHSGGAGYLISTQSLKDINFIDYGIIFDDATVGVNLLRNGVNLIHDERFNPDLPESLGKDGSDIVDQLTYHHISPEKMIQLNGYLKDKK